MASLNKVMIIGNAGRDAELRYLANGTAQAKFSVACSRNFRGPDGDWKEETEWFNVIVWRELAERISQTVTKGKQVYVEGRLSTRSWDDDQGVKHYMTEVVAQQVLLMGRREPGEGGGGGGGWNDDAAAPAAGAGRPAPAQARGGGFGGGARGGGQGFGGGGDVDPDDLPFE
ncbi:MAG: single-stranded DNA-binding protein [Dehalococcoidia bacterium]